MTVCWRLKLVEKLRERRDIYIEGREEGGKERERERPSTYEDDEVPDGFDTTSGKQNGVTRGSDVFLDFQVVIARK